MPFRVWYCLVRWTSHRWKVLAHRNQRHHTTINESLWKRKIIPILSVFWKSIPNKINSKFRNWCQNGVNRRFWRTMCAMSQVLHRCKARATWYRVLILLRGQIVALYLWSQLWLGIRRHRAHKFSRRWWTTFIRRRYRKSKSKPKTKRYRSRVDRRQRPNRSIARRRLSSRVTSGSRRRLLGLRGAFRRRWVPGMPAVRKDWPAEKAKINQSSPRRRQHRRQKWLNLALQIQERPT